MSITNGNGHKPKPKNVLGGELKSCCLKPLTGFYRDGFCKTGAEDRGSHTVCIRVTDDFLKFSKSRGNDLSTPRPEFQFPGLQDGDKWCLVAVRWQEALEAGIAPDVVLEATDEAALQYVSLEDLKKYRAE
ncbi:MAG: DUF2237 domain-containing protein [Acidobacteria bacterium]|nr:DUF2237 domain-containing protein [Acidobacteriota bacterium]MCA1638819.1 DUF2237 domain-containing protein [Acidobacteriota bacterium]